MLVDQLVTVTDPWAMFYGESLFAQTVVTFGHFGGMVISGGLAISADRSAISMVRCGIDERKRYLRVAGGVHKWVIFGLFMTFASGVLLLAADVEIFLFSKTFWLKMGLVGALLLNGMLIVKQEHKLTKTHPVVSRHWRRLRTFATTSLVLWFARRFGWRDHDEYMMKENKHDCSDCPLANRRAFIADAARMLSGAVIAAGMWPKSSAAMPIRFEEALDTRGTNVVYPIPVSDGATIDRSAQVILVRHNQSVFAFRRTCPHQNTALRWRERDGRFQCPKHKSRYTPDGNFISGRATRGMDRFPVSRDGNNIVVDTSRYFKQDEDPAGWDAARVDL